MINNKIVLTLLFIVSGSLLISAEMKNSINVPGGYTGADGITCNNCHGGNVLNSPGGSVVITGLPTSYTPGVKYDFTVTINHGVSNRTRWGFAMKAVANGIPVGTFTESNPNVYINNFDREIGHSSAPTTPSSNTYTFTNLSWTAPPAPNASEQNITFYVAGNAANGIGSSGDFIYTASKSMTQTSTSVTNNNSINKINTALSGKKMMIQISLQRSTTLQIALLNMHGQRVFSNEKKTYGSGSHTIEIDGNSLPSGTYIVSIQNGKDNIIKKIKL